MSKEFTANIERDLLHLDPSVRKLVDRQYHLSKIHYQAFQAKYFYKPGYIDHHHDMGLICLSTTHHAMVYQGIVASLRYRGAGTEIKKSAIILYPCSICALPVKNIQLAIKHTNG
jgi:hypothetical protein